MKRLWLLFAQTATVLLAAYFVVATLKPEWLDRAPGRMLPQIVTIATVPDVPGLPRVFEGRGPQGALVSLAPGAERTLREAAPPGRIEPRLERPEARELRQHERARRRRQEADRVLDRPRRDERGRASARRAALRSR